MAPPPKSILLLLLAISLTIASSAAFNFHHPHGPQPGGGFFEVPWFGPPVGDADAAGAGAGGWGAWGAGGGGYAHHEATPPSTVCMEKGPCYKKRLTCPPKCFKSFSFKDKHGGGGGGGGGCSFDCKKCVATC